MTAIWRAIGHYEWIILELLLVGFLVIELVRTRRAVRRDKDGS